jgi:hypothetical protein
MASLAKLNAISVVSAREDNMRPLRLALRGFSSVYVVAVVIIGGTLALIWSFPAPTDQTTAPKFVVPMTISATTPNGKPATLTNGGNVDFVIMGTWCPYSKQMKRFMNDPVVRPYIARRKLVFLFSTNEWKDVEAELNDLVKAGKITKSEEKETLIRLKKESGSPHLFDPSFLDDLPGDAYISTLPSSPWCKSGFVSKNI